MKPFSISSPTDHHLPIQIAAQARELEREVWGG